MEPISAIAGKALTIKCPVAGYPIETITWERENVRLPTNMWQRVHNGTLQIENVQRATDQGTYTCIARNRQNESSERSVAVKVLGEFIQTPIFNWLNKIIFTLPKFVNETNGKKQERSN